MDLLDAAPTDSRSPPKPARRLEGWRRLWIAWTVVSLPIALWSSAQLNPRAEGQLLLHAEADAKRHAYARAFERITGETVNTPLGAGPATPDSALLPAAVEANIQRYLEILANPDGALRADIERIERDFRPKIDRARAAHRRSFWRDAALVWLALSFSAYVAGATVARLRCKTMGIP